LHFADDQPVDPGVFGFPDKHVMSMPQRPRARDGQAKPLADVSLRLEDGEQYQPQAETKTDKNTRSEPALDILKRIKRKAVFSLPMPAT
jgi:hypothetical protein